MESSNVQIIHILICKKRTKFIYHTDFRTACDLNSLFNLEPTGFFLWTVATMCDTLVFVQIELVKLSFIFNPITNEFGSGYPTQDVKKKKKTEKSLETFYIISTQKYKQRVFDWLINTKDAAIL